MHYGHSWFKWVIHDAWCFRGGVLVISVSFCMIVCYYGFTYVWLWGFSISRVCVMYVWDSWLVTDWPLCSICSTYGCHNNSYMILLFISEKRCRQTMRTVLTLWCTRHSLLEQKNNWCHLLQLNRKQAPWSDNVPHTTDSVFIVWREWIVICMHSATKRWRTFLVFIFLSSSRICKYKENRSTIERIWTH